MKKRILSMLMVFSMLIGMLPAISVTAEGSAASGQCGEEVYWSFDEESGTLTISGEGEMWDWGVSDEVDNPWFKTVDYSAIEKLVVEKGVTVIGDGAFARMDKLTEALLADTVEEIGAGAFAECESLEAVVFEGDAPAELGEGCFEEGVRLYYSADRSGWTDSEGYDAEAGTWNGFELIEGKPEEESEATAEPEQPEEAEQSEEAEEPEEPEQPEQPEEPEEPEQPEETEEPEESEESEQPEESEGTEQPEESEETEETEQADEVVASQEPSASVESDASEGLQYCGDTVYWEFDDASGTLTISGEGDMWDWDSKTGVPWYDIREAISNVVIEDGVTSIGDSAFDDCSSLTSVSIPDGVTCIGGSAFLICHSLTSVIIPDSVTSIGDYAFGWCSGLTSVSIPDSVTSIGDYAFLGCLSLTSVSIPDSVTSIGDYAFHGCRSLTSVNVPDSVTSIGNSAFAVCSSLTKITVDSDNPNYSSDEYGVLFNKEKTILVQYPVGNARSGYNIPNSVTSIGKSAFEVCSSLTSVSIPDSVTSIGDYAFARCSSLTSVIIPDSVTSIGKYTFNSCRKLTSVIIPDSVTSIGDKAFYSCSKLTSVSIPNSVTSIGDSAFEWCNSLTLVCFHGDAPSVYGANTGNDSFPTTSILYYIPGTSGWTDSEYYDASAGTWNGYKLGTWNGEKIVQYCGDTAYWEFDDATGTLTISGEGDMWDSSPSEVPWVDVREDIIKVVIEDGVASIGSYAFYSCSGLTSVSIPDSVTSIGDLAFFYCSGLTEINVDANNAYYSSDEFGVLFDKNKEKLIKYPEGNSRTSYTVPAGVNTIGQMAFFECNYLRNIYLPDGLTRIDDFAFMICANLESLDIPASVTNIASYPSAIFGCASLERITVDPDNQNYSSDSMGVLFNKDKTRLLAYPSGNKATSYDIPDGVTQVDESAFHLCANLVSISIPGSVTYFGISPAGFTCLEEISVDETNEYYAADENGVLFSKDMSKLVLYPVGNARKSYSIPEGVKTIGAYSFFLCSNLESVIIPDGVDSIEVLAFCDSSSLKGAYFKGDAPDSVELPFFDNSVVLYYVPGTSGWTDSEYYDAEAGTWLGYKLETWDGPPYCGDNVTWKYDETTATLTISGEGDMWDWNVYTGMSAPWHEAVDYKSISHIVIENGVSSIGDGAFARMSGLLDVSIPDTVTEIGTGAFADCSMLNTVNIPAGVTSIGDIAFQCCSRLTSVSIPSSVTGIGEGAFSECSSLASVSIPNGIETISKSAFHGCSSLTSVSIPDSVTVIGSCAFAGCSGLTGVVIPAGVTNILDCAFAECGQLRAAYFLGNAPMGAESAFDSTSFPEETTFYYVSGTTGWTDSEAYDADASTWNGHILLEWDGKNITDEGTLCGNAVFWSFDADTGTLTISGRGDMWNYSSSEAAPWHSLRKQIKSVVIEDGVTGIGDFAFYWCEKISSMDIPDGVTRIGANAFRACYELASVSIPNSVVSIGDLAFYYCESLAEVFIPASVESIGTMAFSGCVSIEWISVDQGNKHYSSDEFGVLFDKEMGMLIQYPAGNSAEYYNIPNSVATICENAFEGCHALVGVNIPDSVTVIGKYAFYECYSLVEVNIPDSVTTIDVNAFRGCESIVNLRLGSGVENIGNGAFANCISLSDVIIPASVTDIGSYAFDGCGLICAAFEGNAPWIGSGCFESGTTLGYFPGSTGWTDSYNYDYINETWRGWKLVQLGNCGDSAYWFFNETNGTLGIIGEGDMWDWKDMWNVPWSGYHYSITDLRIGNNISSIGNHAFYNCHDLTYAIIPDGVIRIGDYAFEYCYNLTDVYIPESVKSIGEHAFFYCDYFYSVYIPAGVEYIGSEAFGGCWNLQEIIVADENQHYCSDEYGVLFNKEKTTLFKFPRGNGAGSYSIPDSVSCIEDHAFEDCYRLTEVNIPDRVTNIGERAFSNCSNLYSVFIPASVEHIGARAFACCYSLKEIEVDEDNQHYSSGEYGELFDKSKAVLIQYPLGSTRKTYDVPDTVATIGEYAFSQCWQLERVHISDSVTEIGDYAFQDCSSIKSVIISDSVSSIGNGAFYGCHGLTSVIIPDGVTSIYKQAFDWCDNLEGIYFEGNAPEVYYRSFDDDVVLYYIPGTLGWTDSKEYDSATETWNGRELRKWRGEDIPEGFEHCGNTVYWNFENGTLTIMGTGDMWDWDHAEVPWYDLRGEITNLVIENGVSHIGDWSFFDCDNLHSVSIPGSVISIGGWTFAGCENLSSVIMGESVQSIGEQAFQYCGNLSGVYFLGYAPYEYSTDSIYRPFPLTTYLYYIDGFGGWTDSYYYDGNESTWSGWKLYKWDGHNTLRFCGDSVYWDFDSNTGTLTISGKGDMWGFIWNSMPWSDWRESIKSVVIEDGVTGIGNYAFYDCSDLANVSIPDSVTSIGNGAFMYCRSLTSVTISDSVTNMGVYAFAYCRSLVNLHIGNGVTSISDSAFYHCYKLANVSIPDSVTSIGNYAFAWCNCMTSVSIGESVTSIGDYAFAWCYPMTSVSIGESVTSIGQRAFYCCESLISVSIPDSVTSIGDYAFLNCMRLTSVYFYGDAPDVYRTNSGRDSFPFYTVLYYIPGTTGWTDSNAYDAASGRWNGYRLYKWDGENMLQYCGDSMYWELDTSTSTLTIFGSGEMWDYSGTDAPWYWLRDRIGYVEVKDGVTGIGDWAFAYCHNLSDISISDSVSSIGDYAFYSCYTMDSIEFGEGISNIGHFAFERCYALTSVEIPASVKTIGNGAFWYCGSLAEIIVDAENKNYSSDDYGVLFNKSKTELIQYPIGNDRVNYSVPDGVTSIADLAFGACYKLMSVRIPGSVAKIGGGAFLDCCSLSAVCFSGDAPSVSHAQYSYASFTVMTTLYYVEGSTGWTNSAYYDARFGTWNGYALNKWNGDAVPLHCGDRVYWELDSATGVLTISGEGDMWNFCGTDAPWYNFRAQISSVVIEEGVTGIGDWAFAHCFALDEVNISDSVKYIGEHAFYCCYILNSVDLGEGVVNIGHFAFEKCYALSSINIPASVESIGNGAFWYCSSLEVISVDAGNANYCSDEYGVLFDRSMSTLIQYPIGNDRASYDVPEGVKAISDLAFGECANLVSVVISASVSEIRSGAFLGCSSLNSVYFCGNAPAASHAQYSYAAFPAAAVLYYVSGTTGWTDSELYDAETGTWNGYALRVWDGEDAPQYCGKNVTWSFNEESGVLSITGSGAMDDFAEGEEPWAEYADQITEVVIADGVTELGENAFAGMENLSKLSIPYSLSDIPETAFVGCGIEELTITGVPEGASLMAAVYDGGRMLTVAVIAPVDGVADVNIPEGDRDSVKLIFTGNENTILCPAKAVILE